MVPCTCVQPHSTSGKAVGNGKIAVIVRMNAQGRVDFLPHGAEYSVNFIGQRSAIGVAQHKAVGAAAEGAAQNADGIVGMSLVPVEKMLGIEKNFRHMPLEIGYRLLDKPQVVIRGYPEHAFYMHVPGLAENRHRFCPGMYKLVEVFIFFNC